MHDWLIDWIVALNGEVSLRLVTAATASVTIVFMRVEFTAQSKWLKRLATVIIYGPMHFFTITVLLVEIK